MNPEREKTNEVNPMIISVPTWGEFAGWPRSQSEELEEARVEKKWRREACTNRELQKSAEGIPSLYLNIGQSMCVRNVPKVGERNT